MNMSGCWRVRRRRFGLARPTRRDPKRVSGSGAGIKLGLRTAADLLVAEQSMDGLGSAATTATATATATAREG
jgi:hypothetical protein